MIAEVCRGEKYFFISVSSHPPPAAVGMVGGCEVRGSYHQLFILTRCTTSQLYSLFHASLDVI